MKLNKTSRLREGTPVHYDGAHDLYVKREDLSGAEPWPAFSKVRGVYAHVKKLEQSLVGVLDTYHSQAGHAVAAACQLLGKECINFYPRYKADPPGAIRLPQQRSQALGARLHALQAGRSAILFHAAKKYTLAAGGYMMPNALKLPETLEETAREVDRTTLPPSLQAIVLPASSGTVAAGVLRGLLKNKTIPPTFTVYLHLGYSRSHDEVNRYVRECSGWPGNITIIDEGYAYKDQAEWGPGGDPTWPCNAYYDLKAFRWIVANRATLPRHLLLWNIG